MQNNNTEIVCRFCLKLVHSENVDLLNAVMNEMLKSLSIKLDLDVSEHPLVCGTCSGVLDEIFLFKSKCLYTEDIISAHIEPNSKVSLRDILIKIKNKGNIHISENEVVCRLCMKILPNGSYTALDGTGEDVSFSRDMIQIHLPQMDLNITEKPIICDVCHACLKNYVSFATNCMAVEEKIKLYCHFKKSSGPIDLACVPQFMEDKQLDLQATLNKDLVIKQEVSVMVKVENVQDVEDHLVDSSSASELYLKNEEIEIKSENEEMIRVCNEEKQMRKLLECHCCDYKSEHERNLKRHISTIHEREKAKVYSCKQCSYKTVNASNLRTHHHRLHGEKAILYRCPGCEKGFKAKQTLHDHLLRKHNNFQHLIDSKIHDCNFCTYKSTSTTEMTRHIFRNHDKTKAEKYQCHVCEYYSLKKYTLRRHLEMVHLNLRPHQCPSCQKGFSQKSDLNSHRQSKHKAIANL